MTLAIALTLALFKSNNPGRLPVGTGVPAVAAGAKHGVIIASDGTLWSWGENNSDWSVLGLGDIKAQTSLRKIGNDTNWTSIAAGWHHTLATKSDGTLWGWGQNIYGQLGNGDTNKPTVPVRFASGNDWKQAAAGGSHSLALKKDGTLWACGNNWAGQLGILAAPEILREPEQVGSATNWAKVWAGLLESVALQSDGTLWFWGDNPDPAIPQTGPQSKNIFAPRRVSPDTNWVDVGFGPWTVLAVKSDGTLWTWGREAHRFTGAADTKANATPTLVGTNSDWQAICPNGWLYQILQKKDGSLWALHASATKWGSTPAIPMLTRLELKEDFAAFAGGGTRPFGVVLTPEGDVWTWGKVLGEDIPERPALQYVAKLLRRVNINVHWGEARPTMRDKPWQLPVSTSDPQRPE